jgi:hypothetical protein
VNLPDGPEERTADADERAARCEPERDSDDSFPCRHVPYEARAYSHLCMYCNERLFPFPTIERITARPVDAELLIRLAVQRLEMGDA